MLESKYLKTIRAPEFMDLVRKDLSKLTRYAERVCRRMDDVDADDVLQEALIRGYRNYHKFRWGSSFSSWMGRIIGNAALDELRRARGRATHERKTRVEAKMEQDDGTSIMRDIMVDDSNLSMDALELRLHILPALDCVLSKIPESYREIWVMSEIEDLTYEEMCATMNVPIGTVKSRLHRARDLVRSMLKTELAKPAPSLRLEAPKETTLEAMVLAHNVA